MANHIYIKQILGDTGNEPEAFTSLKDALKSEGLLHLYRSCTYHLAKGEPFTYPGDSMRDAITFTQIDAEIITTDIIYHESKQINLKRGKHGKHIHKIG